MTVQNDLWRELERMEQNAFSLSQKENLETYRKAIFSLENRAASSFNPYLIYRVRSLAACFQEYAYELLRPENRNTLEGSPRYRHEWVQGRLEVAQIRPVPFWKKYPLLDRRVEWILDPFAGGGFYQFVLGDFSPLPVAPAAVSPNSEENKPKTQESSSGNVGFAPNFSASSRLSSGALPLAPVQKSEEPPCHLPILESLPVYPSFPQSLEEDDDTCVLIDPADPAIVESIIHLKTLDPKAERSSGEMLKDLLLKMRRQTSAENKPLLHATVLPLLEKECGRLEWEFSSAEGLKNPQTREELLHTLIKDLKLVAEVIYFALDYEVEGIEPYKNQAMQLLAKAQGAVSLWGKGTKPAEKGKSSRKGPSKIPEDQAEFFMANMLRDIRVEVEKFEKERDWGSCERAILYTRQLQNWSEEQGIAFSETLNGVESLKKRVEAVLEELIQTAEEALTAFIGIEELAEESRNCTGQIERAKKLANTLNSVKSGFLQ